MAFLIYKKYGNAETIRYEKLQPLKLGGCDGLIARHVKTLAAAQTPSWKLSATGLLKLAGFAGAFDELAVLFDVAGHDGTSVCLYELSRIHGSCADTSTQLALDFAVVVDREIGDDAATYVNSFEIPVPERPRLMGETLALTGGPGGGDWKWAATSLQLGATVVQPQHGHGPGEPCPNCSCGRREAMN
ncbi:MAG: hypothetical protein PHY43_07700 [Verrucomicrobiales bacterium]|nr:hypothetical protein [Verrucomicrobiales bacterium]